MDQVCSKLELLFDRATIVQAIDRVQIMKDTIKMHNNFSARLLKLVNRDHLASALTLVDTYCPEYDK